jgi:hypothetical protein
MENVVEREITSGGMKNRFTNVGDAHTFVVGGVYLILA